MPTLAEQRRRLLARAERLEAELAEVILDLDPAAVERLAQVALSIGFTDAEIEAVFGPAFRRNIETVYQTFAREAAEDAGQLVPEVDMLVDEAVITRLDDLTMKARIVVDDLVETATTEGWEIPALARALALHLPLTPKQNEYVANYERKLRTDARKALRHALRDKRTDRRILADKPLSEAQIARLVDTYRENWRKARAGNLARFELLSAANATLEAVYVNAKIEGRLDPAVRKHWIHMHDNRVRSAHLEIPRLNPDGVEVDATFDTPLGPLRYPLDPQGTEENTSGCRCSIVYSGIPD
jgi:hypothetical protein